MLNDTQANDVMYDIHCLTEEDNEPMLKHLYELHKLRDFGLFEELCHLARNQDLETYYRVALMEIAYA